MARRSRASVLVVGLPENVARRVGATLEAAGCEVVSRRLDDDTILLIETRRFDVLVIGHPLPGAAFGQLLSSVRARSSACHSSGLLLLVPPADVDAVRRLIGRGVNRVLADDAPDDDLVAAVDSLYDVAPRKLLRLPVQLEVNLPSRLLKALCQTENISSSGMLLRGFRNYPPGTVFSFEMQLPEGNVIIRGTAEIARNTDAEREATQGFGARFLDLEHDDRGRLASLLDDGEKVDGVN